MRPTIEDIELEILRAGPPHNQLLSPLTPYTVLCGADSPVSLHLPFEHAQLSRRLDRLRYRTAGGTPAEGERTTEIAELGATIARLFAQVPGLVSALHTARLDGGRLVNIRLRLSAFELGLVPFETTLAPGDAAAGRTAPLLLRGLTGMTREIRRGQPLPVQWNRAPRILFAYASPPGLPAVPAQDHVAALRRAIDPWVGLHPTAAERLVDVRRLLTVVKNASVATIAAACRAGEYTHVHILAHGAPLPGSDGDRRFGICLAPDGDGDGNGDGDNFGEAGAGGGRRADAGASGSAHVVVDGQRLALALTGVGGDGRAAMPAPTVVTLATCDSGNVGSVLTAGGSVAHELHAQGVPWVLASQFPIGMRASTLATEALYAGLLAGDDPREVLHRVRQRLGLELPMTHDWASLVAYAAIPPDLPAQIDAFRSRQTKARLDLRFERIDALVGERPVATGTTGTTGTTGERLGPAFSAASTSTPAPAPPAGAAAVEAELARLGSTVRAELAAWCDEPIARRDPRQRAARLAMRAASEKRIALVYGAWADGDEEARLRSREAYRLACRHYRAALKAEPANHWAITQFLSLIVTPAIAPTEAEVVTAASTHRRWWQAAWQLAEWDAGTTSGGRARAWAHGTLAELELLGAVYAADERTPEARSEAVMTECRRLCEVCDDDLNEDRFPVASTLRQFRRYIENWPRPQWLALAQAAVDVLERAGPA